jgi:hypothetical protein
VLFSNGYRHCGGSQCCIRADKEPNVVSCSS